MSAPASPVSGTIGRSKPRKERSIFTALNHFRRRVLLDQPRIAWALVLLLVVPIADTRRGGMQMSFEHARQLFIHGDLVDSLREARQGYARYVNADRECAAKFLLLEARSLIFQGMYDDALRVLATNPSIFINKALVIQSLTLTGIAYTYLDRMVEADQKLEEARVLCNAPTDRACDQVPFRRGVLAVRQRHFGEARELFLESLSSARSFHDRGAETSALLNLGFTGLQAERYDEAVDWSRLAYRSAAESGQEDLAENAMGNLGFAYYKLGDKEKARQFTLDAEARARKLSSFRNEIKWLAILGLIYQNSGDFGHAFEVQQRSLELATKIDSQSDVIASLENLAYLSIDAGRFDDAIRYTDQAMPLIRKADSHLDELDVELAQGEVAAARHQPQAESLFHAVEEDKVSQISMRLEAEHQLARLYEAQNSTAAQSMYRTALSTFDAARNDLKKEDSVLPFFTNATPIYDDYIHFLVKQNRIDEALAAADQSRAQTLAQGLGLDTGKPSLKPAALRAADVARKSGATVLFYWLGKQQSYLWAITPQKTSLFPLPSEKDITQRIERYRKALLEPALGRDRANTDGEALYETLVAPGAEAIQPDANVVVVCDGVLSLLNFETLVVPWPKPHYWIEDANVVSAPSLSMLAARQPPGKNRQLLLMGDAVPPNLDYPRLPKAGAEIEEIEKHFSPAEETVYERQAANAGAYLKSPLRDYAYIHFVAHGVASRTDPLDSAIILSRMGTAEDSFKLHAREIIQHPIDARLVTISACYGGGTRSYAGEGLVGLSWAFLRAGAHNVIGALWEASDDSTPQLMDKMYAGLAEGKTPSTALREAKLALLHSETKFREPFYWAPFQIYAGL